MGVVEVYVERTPKRAFACAVDWPGWARHSRTEEAALESLLSYRDRYARIAARAGVRLPRVMELRVVERVPGNATTEFGAPAVVPELDARPLSAKSLTQQLALLRAAWSELDQVVAGAPAELRKGPRGGGRDRDKVLSHVVEAERAYARKVGVRQAPFDPLDPVKREAFRAAELAGLSSAVDPAWPVAYAIRRMAWHVVDHAWEIEDRSE